MNLFDFASIYNFPDKLEVLKNLAMPEDWDYKSNPTKGNPILKNYIIHTFKKAYDEGKIGDIGNYSAFNTGLATPLQEEIYGLFQKNRKQGSKPWFLIGWFKESDRDLSKFPQLPEVVNYFKDPSELIYDTSLSLRRNLDHIIDDNFERFPDDIKRLQKHLIINLLDGTISDALNRIKRNYKTAVPQFYNNKLQLLLPLCLQSRGVADLALVIEKENGFYRASTILTLDMAINNARLIAKPDDEWLKG